MTHFGDVLEIRVVHLKDEMDSWSPPVNVSNSLEADSLPEKVDKATGEVPNLLYFAILCTVD